MDEEAAPRLAPSRPPSTSSRWIREVRSACRRSWLEHRLGDGEVGVVPDQVHQLARPHAEAGATQAGVDRRRLGRAFQEQGQRLGVVGAGDAVDDEARRRARVHRRLAPALAQVEDRFGHGGVGLQAGDDLDQLHQRHRVEEVHADEAPRQAQPGSQGGDRDRGGVRGQQAVLADARLEVAEQLRLRRRVLDDGLDHQRRAGGLVEARSGAHARGDGPGLRRV
jgi:hypothetical protein